MAVTNIFDLDLNQFRYDYYAFFVNQGDYQSRTIQSNLYITYIKDGTRTDYNLTDETITISYEYTNGNGEIQNSEEFGCTKATSIGNNVITFLIPNIVVENPGKVRAQVKIYGGESILINTTSFLFYVGESINVGTIEDLQIPLLYVSPIIDSGAPTTSTQGVVGQLYINDTNDSIYYCSDITGEVYTWNILFDGNYIAASDFNANTILAATLDDTPVALTITEQTVVGRATGGNIAALAIDSDLSSVSANDDTLPSAKATKSALDGKLDKSTFDAHTILYATTDDTPLALTVGEQTIIGRATGENISALTIDSTLSSEPASHNTLPSAKIVHQKLATKANQTLTDAGDYYTVKTPEGALQEVGAQLAGNAIKDLLFRDYVEGAIATLTFDGDDVTQIIHVIDSAIIRTDAYTYPDANTVAETRTLSSGEHVTLVYHSDTGIVEVGEIA